MKNLIPFSVVLILTASCSNKIIYYGRTYAPTDSVEIYFREGDITEPNEIMGKATYEVTAKRNSDKVQSKIVDRMKAKGADAILFDEIALTNTGSNTGGAVAGAGRRRGFLGIFGSKTKYTKGQMIKATLLKYKKNLQ
jgi:ABC-type branched-subunit amino acid transport system substrate-binding protein